MKRFKRIFLIVLDSVGIGEAPDAAKFNDEGAHTLGHIAEHIGGLHMPNMEQLGLGNIDAIQGINEVEKPAAFYTKMQEASHGKDTMTCHWEIMGLHSDQSFRTVTKVFPAELIQAVEEETNLKLIGNKPASGTAILEGLGKEHMETGAVIVYSSA